jgi:small acid-soluble spore protein L (minor)
MENSFFETCVDFSSMQVFYWGIFYKFLILERCSQKEATSFLIYNSSDIIYLEVKEMSKKTGRGRIAPSVNPQGHGKDVEFSTEPKSELENKAKKSNTK